MVAVVLTCLLAAVAVMLVVHCEGLLGSSHFYCIWHHHRALLVVVVILVELIFVVFMPVELLSRSRSSSSKQEQRQQQQQQQQRSGGQCDPETESLVIEASCGCLACCVRVVTKTKNRRTSDLMGSSLLALPHKDAAPSDREIKQLFAEVLSVVFRLWGLGFRLGLSFQHMS